MGLIWLLAAPQAAVAASMIFGREELFTLNSGNISALKSSGFTTVTLFVVDVETNGDLNFNGDHLIITNGVYMGDSAWPSRLASLRTAQNAFRQSSTILLNFVMSLPAGWGRQSLERHLFSIPLRSYLTANICAVK